MTPQKVVEKDLDLALAAESQRFRNCLAARKILASPPSHVKVHHLDASPLARYPWFSAWQQGFHEAGFQPAGHYAVVVSGKSAYTNRELGFDAVLSVRGDQPSCEVTAYHPDETMTVVGNLPPLPSPDFNPRSMCRVDLIGGSPAQLVEYLRKLVLGKEISRVDSASFAQRYTSLLNRLLVETRERAQQILETPSILINGSAPRYERLGCYLDFVGAGYNDPDYSTANWVRRFKEDFSKADGNPPKSTDNAIGAAMYLIVMSHLQYASAIEPSEFLALACEVALTHFQTLAKTAKWCSEVEPWFQFRALLRGLLLCALADRWETFKEICNLVKPKLASANTAQEEDLEFAQVLLLLVSSYRDVSLEKAASLERSVAKRLTKGPRLLLDVWRAIRAGRAADFDEALRRSLEYFVELRPDRIGSNGSNDLYRVVALPESLFHLAARERSLKLSPLEPKFADMLITPETIGIR